MIRVVLDTNILVSAIVYGGKPKFILDLVLQKSLFAITSKTLLAELFEVLSKKFPLSQAELSLVTSQIEQDFILVSPRKILKVVSDVVDNRVLEAAIEGECDFIVTGDKDLLNLVFYKKMKIVNAQQFIKKYREKISVDK